MLTMTFNTDGMLDYWSDGLLELHRVEGHGPRDFRRNGSANVQAPGRRPSSKIENILKVVVLSRRPRPTHVAANRDR